MLVCSVTRGEDNFGNFILVSLIRNNHSTIALTTWQMEWYQFYCESRKNCSKFRWNNKLLWTGDDTQFASLNSRSCQIFDQSCLISVNLNLNVVGCLKRSWIGSSEFLARWNWKWEKSFVYRKSNIFLIAQPPTWGESSFIDSKTQWAEHSSWVFSCLPVSTAKLNCNMLDRILYASVVIMTESHDRR